MRPFFAFVVKRKQNPNVYVYLTDYLTKAQGFIKGRKAKKCDFEIVKVICRVVKEKKKRE